MKAVISFRDLQARFFYWSFRKLAPFICGAFFFLTLTFTQYNPTHKIKMLSLSRDKNLTFTIMTLEDKSFDYADMTFEEGFNNETGVDKFIVPNIIHFIRFNNSEFTLTDYIIIGAAMRNHRPDNFYIHSDVPEENFTGKYWERIKNDMELFSRISVKYVEEPVEIFGQKFHPQYRHPHASDIVRIQVIMKYGGIYLDNDAYIHKSLHKYRKFECVVNWAEDFQNILQNQVIMAHKNARILPIWLETYRVFHATKWYYNGGQRPTEEILDHRPELIHRTTSSFLTIHGCKIFTETNFNWRQYEVLHLMINHRYYQDSNYKNIPVFTEEILRNYSFSYGEMATEILDWYSLKDIEHRSQQEQKMRENMNLIKNNKDLSMHSEKLFYQ